MPATERASAPLAGSAPSDDGPESTSRNRTAINGLRRIAGLAGAVEEDEEPGRSWAWEQRCRDSDVSRLEGAREVPTVQLAHRLALIEWQAALAGAMAPW
jgi:hypothetical protein